MFSVCLCVLSFWVTESLETYLAPVNNTWLAGISSTPQFQLDSIFILIVVYGMDGIYYMILILSQSNMFESVVCGFFIFFPI